MMMKEIVMTKRILLLLLLAASLGMNSASTYAVSAKVKKSGKITFHAAKLVCALWLCKGVGFKKFYLHRKLTILGPIIAATAYLIYDGCAGIYKELKTWNESNEIRARRK